MFNKNAFKSIVFYTNLDYIVRLNTVFNSAHYLITFTLKNINTFVSCTILFRKRAIVLLIFFIVFMSSFINSDFF